MFESLINQLNPEGSDEEDNPESLSEFTLELGHAEEGTIAPADCGAIIVCTPGPAAVYLRALLPSLKPAPWLLKVVKEPERRFPPPPKPAKFLIAGTVPGEAVAVALLEKDIPADLAYTWSSGLLAGFPKASRIIFMDMIARAEWRLTGEQERPEEPHLAGLWTSAWGSGTPCPAISALPSPNFLGGLPAALLSQCEAANKRGLAALALQDGAHLMASSLVGFEALRPLLSDLGLECEKAPDLVEALGHMVREPSLSIYS